MSLHVIHPMAPMALMDATRTSTISIIFLKVSPSPWTFKLIECSGLYTLFSRAFINLKK